MPKARAYDGQLGSGAQETALLDYEGAARYLCTTPRHVRELTNGVVKGKHSRPLWGP